ncbi:MAG: prolipoprotein diacylglyceryl transferase [Bacteroidaceae bacterium]|nr:prolipoprotein diacylglyceryl transferase [Bacteroidaceae bacterium]
MLSLFIDWQPSLEIFRIGFIPIRWYSICWVIGLVLAFIIVMKIYRHQKIEDEKFDPLFIYCFFGIIAGARLGHCIFYEPEYYLTSVKGFIEMLLPIRFAPDSWSFNVIGYAGLASHGGTIGIILAMIMYARNVKMPILHVIDNVAIAVPVTAGFIRLGNLMNSEIIGNVTDVPWAFIFHSREALVDGMLVPRHPAQLYEAIAYFVIFVIQYAIFKTKQDKSATFKPGNGFYFGFCITTIFLFRFFIEFLKKEQVDFEQGMILDMGQILSIPFCILGTWLMWRASKQEKAA